MINIDELNKDTILGDEVFMDLMETNDPIDKQRKLVRLTMRAKELGVKTFFEQVLKGYKDAERDIIRQQKEKNSMVLVNNFTNFTDSPYDNMFCGFWIASDNGIFAQQDSGLDDIACYHPILPVERLKNLETGEEQIKLAYKRNEKWQEIVVPKTMITSANKIVALSGRGIAVTSENARLLVKYLSDVENGNDSYINVQYSTSKLGWHGEDFIPYDKVIVFDGDSRFKQLFESIGTRGSYDTWKAEMVKIRALNRKEIKFLLAASFSSALVKKLGALPFFVDLWGETEGGKTVTEMVAASVWANPDESQYIGDFKTTDVALEAKADMLNNLPMILDDTSKTSSRIRDNFEGIVYDLCSGKGKSRSNRDLGINRENRWSNVIITNGERPLNSYVNQGGAINRILEVECEEKVYDDPQRTAETVKKHYGFAGEKFINIIKEVGIEDIKKIQKDFLRKIESDSKMQKQAISLSIVLTADKLATDYIFKDGAYLSLKDAKTVLIDRNDLSDNERCYNFLMDKVGMNAVRFDATTNCEKWGLKEGGYAIFYSSAFEQLCKDGGFSKKSFLSWANKKGVIQTDNGRNTKVKKIDGSPIRCVFLKINNGIDENGFIEIDENINEEDLPPFMQ